MTHIPRRQQKQIFIRSDKAAALLAELARDGRTKVSILEDALRHMLEKSGDAAKP
jgi:hypothetical protein